MAAAGVPSIVNKTFFHLLLRHPTLPAAVCLLVRRPCYTATATASQSPRPIRTPPSTTITTTTTTYDADKTNIKRQRNQPLKDPNRENDPDYRKWKDKETEIFLDIDPITLLIKDILHSDRYMDGERLTPTDEKMVVEKVLAYHPHSEDKIGSGLDSIMVDRHPQFRNSRCLFVVRTDGIWIDFSYQKCIRSYIRQKYPSHAERFIKEHYKRSSS